MGKKQIIANGLPGDTLATMFWNGVAQRSERVLLRDKEFGIWQSMTWREAGERAKAIGLGLASLGLKPGDCAAILANNVKEWVLADFGILGAGGVSAGIYPTDAPAQVEYLLNDSAARFIFVEDEEQLDKVLEVREKTPTLEKIIVFDMKGLRDFSDPMAISLEALEALGAAHGKSHPALWEERTNSRGAEDVAILVYTSGTTGPPKGAMLSHSNIIFQLRNGGELLPVIEGDERLSYLPLCHVAERIPGWYATVYSGAIANFVESPETLPENAREVSSTVFGGVPRVYEKFYSGINIAISEATWLQQWAYRMAIGIGYKVADARIAGRPISRGLRAAQWLGYVLVLKNIRRMMGMDRARWMVVGAAPISPELIRWYLALGLDLLEVYGQTENGALATCMTPDAIRPGTVGRPVPYGELKISPEGEILLRGEHVFLGYLNQPEKTAETIRDGWLHTGDVGKIDEDGFVRILDRMKDIIITAGGKNVTPSEIENQLKFSPYITDAVVIGDRRKYLTSLVMIDHENVLKFAQNNDVPFTNFASLCAAREVVELIGREVEKVNSKFAQVEQIKKFRLIDRLLTPEDGELTPTMKLKRKFVSEKYSGLIESMYKQAKTG